MKNTFGLQNCTLEEMAVLQIIQQNPRITQKQIAAEIGKSERTVKTLTVNLTQKGMIIRRNGKRDGYWEILNYPPPRRNFRDRPASRTS